MRVAISGSRGLIGSGLRRALEERGDTVIPIVRSGEGIQLSRPNLEGIDAVIHLAGRGIAEGRWTARAKEEIRRSRVDTTSALAAAITPSVKSFLCASAIGFYGSRGEEILREESRSGEGFLAATCREWEAAARKAENARVVHLRFGVVLSSKGGALAKMLPPFRLGLGGRVGDGQQFVSWIGLQDAIRAILFLLDTSISGPVNVVAPNHVRNAEFASLLGRVLHRPAVVPVPAFTLQLLFGEMANELLLASQRVIPAKLLEAGFQFQTPELTAALEEALR